MAQKKRTGGRPFGQRSQRETYPQESELTIATYEDVANSEDEFDINRDKILLEDGPARKRQRTIPETGD